MQIPTITRDHVKAATRFVVARSVSTTISLIIHQNVDADKKLDIVSIHVGAYVIGDMVADAAKERVDAKIDGACDTIDKVKAAIDKAKTTS